MSRAPGLRRRFFLPPLLLILGLLVLVSTGFSRGADLPINVLVLYFGSRDQPALTQVLDEFRAGQHARSAAFSHAQPSLDTVNFASSRARVQIRSMEPNIEKQ